jgi:hypothetical protein
MLGIRSTGPPLHSAQTGSRHSTHAIEGPSPRRDSYRRGR